MKSLGVVRKIDDLGRYVIPKEVRIGLGWTKGTPIATFIEGDRVILQEYKAGCSACGQVGKLTRVLTFDVCEKCKGHMRKALEINEG